jgi:hypothetical protein
MSARLSRTVASEASVGIAEVAVGRHASVVNVRVELVPRVEAQLDIVVASYDGGAVSFSVQVVFPEEARATLETVSWPLGRSVHETVATLAVRHALERSDGASPTEPGRAVDAASPTLAMSHAMFRIWLEESLGAGPQPVVVPAGVPRPGGNAETE